MRSQASGRSPNPLDRSELRAVGWQKQQPLEKAVERGGVENCAHHANELTAADAEGAETRHGLAGRGVLQDGVLDFRGYPHVTARTVLLEVTFIQTPQFDVGTASQATELIQWSG